MVDEELGWYPEVILGSGVETTLADNPPQEMPESKRFLGFSNPRRPMRYKFAREGVDTVLNTHLNTGSLHWDDEPIPVHFGADWNVKNLIGKATDLRREDDGWITAEIEWYDNAEPVVAQLGHDCHLTIYANQISEEDRRTTGTQRVVRMAKLRAIYAAMGSDPWEEKERGRGTAATAP